MARRKPVLIALALVAFGMSAWAASTGLPFRQADPQAPGCSSCDARHQNVGRLRAALAEETAP